MRKRYRDMVRDFEMWEWRKMERIKWINRIRMKKF